MLVVGFLDGTRLADPNTAAFRQGLSEIGYVDGRFLHEADF